MRFVLLLVALLAPAALAQGVVDPQTGEPVPLGLAPLPGVNEVVARGGDPLVPAAHLPAGSTRLVRVLPGELVAYSDGAQLVVRYYGVVTADTPLFPEVARVDLPALPTDAVLAGDLFYVTLSKAPGLVVYDVSGLTDDTPELEIVEAGRADLPGAFAVAVRGETLFLGRGTAGVSLHDADPTDLAELASFDTPGSANGLATFSLDLTTGVLLAVADGDVSSGDDFRVFDVTDPGAISEVGSAETGGFATSVAVRLYGSAVVAFVTGAAGLIAFDVNGNEPFALDTFETDGTTYEVAFAGETAYVNGLDGVVAVDVGDPEALAPGAAYDFGGQGLSLDAAVDADFSVVFAGDRFGGLRVLDTVTLDEQARFENGGFAHKPAFGEAGPGGAVRFYVTDLAGRLRTFERTTAGDIAELVDARVSLPANTQEVLVRDGVAYVTHAAGLTVLDVSAVPYAQLADVASQQSYGLALQGDVLYVANGFGGLLALDVTDPAAPQALSATDVGANVVDVDVTEFPSVAYLVSFGGGMLSYDVADPAVPVQLGAEPDFGFLGAIDVDRDFSGPGDVAYVADAQSGLRAVDVEAPTDLTSLFTVPVSTQARDVAVGFGFYGDVFGGLVYVADDSFGLQRFDPFLGEAQGFESADRGIGVAALNDLEQAAGHVPDLALLAAGEAGLYVFEGPFFTSGEPVASGGALALGVWPNPARGAVRFAVELSAPAGVEAAVYDVLGRRVATLAAGELAAGSHELAAETDGWAPGVYTVHVRAGEAVATRRFTVVR